MKMNFNCILHVLVYGFVSLIIWGCQSSTMIDSNVVGNVDSSEIVYDSTDILIGGRKWMSKNLERKYFRNGDTIFHAKNYSEWTQAGKVKKSAWCYYNFDSTNGSKYGILYNFYAVNDKSGLAPKGYHIPTDNEWGQLSDSLGGEYKAGSNMKGNSMAGVNKNKFNAVFGGCIINSEFKYIEERTFWWTSTSASTTMAFIREVSNNSAKLSKSISELDLGFSVRCIRSK